jgi:hypothetical protein
MHRERACGGARRELDLCVDVLGVAADRRSTAFANARSAEPLA